MATTRAGSPRRQLQPGDRMLRPETNRPVVSYQRPLGLDEPWEDERCGTYAGWNAHKYLGEEPCIPCKNAQAATVREWRIRTGRTRHRVTVLQRHRDEAIALAVMAA